ncbi:MAG: sodium ion-translocating decarboxylase subunit beta [Eubacteriales bacterium]|nr:sodium ion-translocating decarboxylase subunit beta [Eubacteriales bacterium]MDD3198728.1 sodium ion-translocating decarboxylase subunit beta [Eubacteriales bacterium]MDD4122049.1 sodium ion-translocating decarboxylase subunit beta [Eubacteriales bacterium]MDD4629026.1 sodium ion-translocating decarboxylase subunit beta [Eubacteriales bacterium]
MEFLFTLFQGIGTLAYQEPKIAIARVVLIIIGIIFVWLGKRGTLEPLIMIPMGFGMAAVNAGVLFFSPTETGTLFTDTLASDTESIMYALQIDVFQPIYTFAFGNNLIACLVFMGIGVLADVGNVLRFPFTSMLIALFAELGSVATFPIAVAMGLNYSEAAAISIVGGADGPMVLFTALMLAPEIFVPITVIAYLYLSLTYGAYPFLIRAMVPRHLRELTVKVSKKSDITSGEKIAFDIIACTFLSLLLPVAAPLLLSFFLGNAIKESGMTKYVRLLDDVFLYTATFFLGLMLGVLCEASTLLNPKVLILLILGVIALGLSGIGGIIGGYVVYLINGKKFNPVIGIAGVSCVPTTAKIAQHEAALVNKRAIILQFAMGANICGVITTAILTGVYVSVIPLL